VAFCVNICAAARHPLPPAKVRCFLGEFRTSVRGTFVTEQKYPKVSLKPAVLRIPFYFSFLASSPLGLSAPLRPAPEICLRFCVARKERSMAAGAETWQVLFLWRSNVMFTTKPADRVCALRKTKLCPFLPTERLARRKARGAAQQKEKTKGGFGTAGSKRRFGAFFAEEKGTRTAVRNFPKTRRVLLRAKEVRRSAEFSLQIL